MWNKNFFLLWQGLFISQVGSQLFNFALLYWVLEVTGSATQMGFVLMAAAVPALLLGPFAGTLADNVSRKHLIVWADVLRGTAGICFVMVLWYGETGWALPTLILAQILFGIGNAVFTPAVGASIPDLVAAKDLPAANSMIQGTSALTAAATYGIGGFLYVAIGAPWLFLVNGVSYLCSAVTECFIKLPRQTPKEPFTRHNLYRKFRDETIDGVHYVLERRGLRTLIMLLGLINCVIVPVGISIPIYVRDFLNSGPEFLGIMASVQAVGGVAGFVLTGVLKVSPGQRPYMVLVTMSSLGIILIGLGLTTSTYVILPLLFMYGAFLPMMNVNIISLIQGTTPTFIRGRVISVLTTLVLVLIPLSQGFSGVAIDAVDQQVPTLFITIGVLLSTIVIATSFSSTSLRQYLATDYTSAATR